MFVPGQYREPDASWPVELVRENPLAELVSNGTGGEPPYATHVPVILDPRIEHDPPALDGLTLWGHMNRANPHWRALASGDRVVVLFTGPHAYVSPTVYRTAPAAPTWNFTAVHVRGVLTKVETLAAGEETLATVTSTVRAFEGRFGNGWDMTESVGYFRKIVPAVGAFRIAVSHVDGMFKLSQEQRDVVRCRVERAFAASGHDGRAAVAAMMNRLTGADADR